jgi:uncharacterized membrane protein
MDLKENVEQINNGTYGLSKQKNAQSFKTGAIIGFFGGAIVGWYFRNKIITYGAIGLVIGGYVGYKISDASELKTEFKNFSKLNLNLGKYDE